MRTIFVCVSVLIVACYLSVVTLNRAQEEKRLQSQATKSRIIHQLAEVGEAVKKTPLAAKTPSGLSKKGEMELQLQNLEEKYRNLKKGS